jgi:hypothetical protein
VLEFFGDIQEAPVEALELAPGSLIGESPAVHLQKMAGGSEGLV